MTDGPELEIDGDLFKALAKVLGREPTEAEPVVVLAAYVHSLAKGYGLSDSQRLPESQLGRGNPPAPAKPLIEHFLTAAGSFDGDVLRDCLYDVFVALSEDGRARRVLNENAPLSEVGFLKAAQILWNLEATESRPRLPIPSGQAITTRGGPVRADIKVPNANDDFATMTWTKRTNHGATGLGAGGAHQSSGQGFRTKGARLAVLAAQHLIAGSSQPGPTTGEAVLRRPDHLRRRAAIVWPAAEPDLIAPSPETAQQDTTAVSLLPEGHLASNTSAPWAGRILVGSPAAVSSTYQRRSFDDELDRLWSGSGDRRVWLRGGPGVGKSYTARRIMQDAVTNQNHDRDDLLIWVDSADPESVRQAFSEAVDRMPHLGIKVPLSVPDRVERQSRALTGVLVTSTWRWLIVLDNANAAGLIESGLIPTGGNLNGRVLITTVNIDHRMTGYGHLLRADQFTLDEAEAFLRAQIDAVGGGPANLARASMSETASLAAAVGYHPLALSIAAATIICHGMEIRDWITEFNAANAMDRAADAGDAGGYPHLIGATWRLALAKASQGLPDGLVERAAMVAALQDPDGHPTWVWDDAGVVGWVAAGATLDRAHGVPRALERLADYGMIERRGPWRQGVVAIHQLAARAVRELADSRDLADLAGVLVDAWLLHLSEDETGTRAALRRNLEPLAALPGLSTPTDLTITALLGYSSPPSALEYAWDAETLEGITNYLAKGGPTGQAALAHQLARRGDIAAELGLLDEAQARRAEAAEIYQQLSADTATADEEERANYLYRLGNLYEKLGQVDQVREAFTQALGLYQTLPDTDFLARYYLVELADIHEALGDRYALDATLERAGNAFDAITDGDLVAQMRDRDPETRWHLEAIAKKFRLHRQLDRAERVLTLMVEALQGLGHEAELAGALRELARILAEAGRWADAVDVLTRVATGDDAAPGDLVLLASIQMHLGRVDDSTRSLVRAVKVYRSGENVPPKLELDDLSDSRRDRLRAATLRIVAAQAVQHGRWDDAASLSEGLVDFHRKRADCDPGEREHEHALAGGNLWLAAAKLQTGQPSEAVEPLTRAIKIYQMLTELNPDEQDAQSGLAEALGFLAVAHISLHRLDEAATYSARAIDIVSTMPDPEPDDRLAQDNFAAQLGVLGALCTALGNLDEARILRSRSLRIRLMTAQLDPGSVSALRNLGQAEYELGVVILQLDEPEAAETWLTRAVDDRQKLVDLDADDRDAQRELADALIQLGNALVQLECFDDAERTFTRAVEIRRSLADSNPDNRDIQKALAFGLAALGVVCRTADRHEDAVDCLTRATNILLLLIDLAPNNPEPNMVKATILFLTQLADTLRSLGRFDEADTVSAKAEELAKRFPNPPSKEDR